MKIDSLDMSIFQEYIQGYYVYILLNDLEVVYVGQTNHIQSRVRTHKKRGVKFNKIMFHSVPQNDMNNIEQQLIAKYQPEFNTKGTNKQPAPSKYTNEGRRQELALHVINAYLQQHGHPPTCRQIAEKMDIRTSGSVCSHLKKLRSKGLIEGGGRTLVITSKGRNLLKSRTWRARNALEWK